jgi:hypothetical protein
LVSLLRATAWRYVSPHVQRCRLLHLVVDLDITVVYDVSNAHHQGLANAIYAIWGLMMIPPAAACAGVWVCARVLDNRECA